MTAQQVVLHVGAMKSGTSFLQSLLFANKGLLLERGVLLPGHKWGFQVHAVRSVISQRGEQWNRLVEEVKAHPGTSVVSMEFLGPLRPRVARRVVESFGGIDVRVVVTARDLNRTVAAMWQETVQNGRTWTWEDYLTDIEAWRPGHRRGQVETEAGRTFWRQHGLGQIVKSWSEVVGPQQVTLVTVPHPGAPRDLLWERFAAAVGTDPGGLQPALSANESIGAASTLALRRMNELLEQDGLSRHDGAHLRKSVLAKKVLAARKKQEPVIGLPVAPWVEDQARRTRRMLTRLGVPVVGDLDELTPIDVPGVDPATVDGQEVAEAALAALSWAIAARIREEAGTTPVDAGDLGDAAAAGDDPGDEGHDPDGDDGERDDGEHDDGDHDDGRGA